MTINEYKDKWLTLGPLQIQMIEKNEDCKHKLYDTFYYKNPYDKPVNVCNSLLHVLDLFTWRVALGFPSWESDNRKIYRIHCPAKKGTVWELKKVKNTNPDVPMIKKIKNQKDLAECVPVINQAFSPVAAEFSLTKQNCPSHPSFMTLDKLKKLKETNIDLFVLEFNKIFIGFIAIEKADESLFYIEKLAVLPEYQKNGYGKMLIDFACQYIKSQKGKKISVGIMDNHVKLKNWYKNQKFKVVETKSFSHLPFSVCFLNRNVE